MSLYFFCYMRQLILQLTDFEKFYWPTFEKVVHMTAARGQAMLIFLEKDWTRNLD